MDPEQLYDEKALLVQIANGNEAAFAKLFHAYSAKLASYVAGLLNSDTWAEEIVQEVFLKLWMNRLSLTAIDNPQAYIFRMASNKVLDHIKRHALQVKLQYHIARRVEQGAKNFTQDLIDYRFSVRLFQEAVHKLSPQRLLAYKLRHEEGLSYDEIALRLKISKNTVRKHLVAALDSIRAYLLENQLVIVLSGLLMNSP